jgi:hypothetical protein
MDMKHTQELNVFIDNHLATGDLVIHPNDGFDLGLMNAQYPVSIYNNTPAARNNLQALGGRIHLSNACKSGTLQISQKQWELIGKKQRVILCIKSEKVFIVTQHAKHE